MNYTQFRKVMKAFPVFSIQEVEKNFPGFDNRRLVEWQKKGYIQKLRNCFYCFRDLEINEPILLYTANELYHPSYISLESALSRYGFIPEGVFRVISCTTLKTQTFNTPLGHFDYRHVKPTLFFGYQLEEWNGYRYAIADPEKTIIDYLYLHSEINEIEDIEILRWNPVEINQLVSMEKLEVYESYINSPSLNRRLNILKKFLNVTSQ